MYLGPYLSPNDFIRAVRFTLYNIFAQIGRNWDPVFPIKEERLSENGTSYRWI